MTVSTINIQLDERIVQMYRATPPEKRERLQRLIGFLVEGFANGTPQSLLSLMDEIGHEAEAKGLTPDILESILRDDT